MEHLIGLAALQETRVDVVDGSGSVASMILWSTSTGHPTEHVALSYQPYDCLDGAL